MTTALPTAPAAYGLKGPSATVTVDNATPQGSTYRCGNSVQTNGTTAHRHETSEEIYHVTRGSGRMTLGVETFAIAVGDSIAIAPGTPHCVENAGTDALHILCCCAPAYSHDDTTLL